MTNVSIPNDASLPAQPAREGESLAERMSHIEAALAGKLHWHTPKPKAAATPATVDVTAQASTDSSPAAPEGPPQLQQVAGTVLDGTYVKVDAIDQKTLAAIEAEGLHPPQNANGFIKFDPYGMANTISEAIVFYFDKIELPIPDGHLPLLVKHIAFYNDLVEYIDAELEVGQYIWFPAKKVLKAWSHEKVPYS